mmetsp:Transcript_39873/g.69119  ORF Transcript_39873/g.69119 Transcript_39873/m.69119 type:complete len:316 (-) Transcript_39873:79-1026(-)
MPAAIRASSFSDITNLLASRSANKADAARDATCNRHPELSSEVRGHCRAFSSIGAASAQAQASHRPTRSSSRGSCTTSAATKQHLEEIWDLGAAFSNALDRLQALRAARGRLGKPKSGSQSAVVRRSDPAKSRQRPELHEELGKGNCASKSAAEDEAASTATADAADSERGPAEEAAGSPCAAEVVADKENEEQEQQAESGDLHADIDVNAAPVRAKRHSWAFPSPQVAGTTEPAVQIGKEALSSKPNGHFHQAAELWGKREANGFAGKPMNKDSKCRLSKAEAEAALQRLINAGTKVDFDEVRRLRKLINEAGG